MKIKVKSKVGDTIHPKYGNLKKGETYLIDKEDLGDEIFEPEGGDIKTDIKNIKNKKVLK